MGWRCAAPTKRFQGEKCRWHFARKSSGGNWLPTARFRARGTWVIWFYRRCKRRHFCLLAIGSTRIFPAKVLFARQNHDYRRFYRLNLLLKPSATLWLLSACPSASILSSNHAITSLGKEYSSSNAESCPHSTTSHTAGSTHLTALFLRLHR